MSKTSAKMSELKGCLCLQFMPYRMSSYDYKTKKHELTLGCMVCGRTAHGATPRECVDKWNSTNTENALKLALVQKKRSQPVAKQKLSRKGVASRKGAVAKNYRNAAGREQPRPSA